MEHVAEDGGEQQPGGAGEGAGGRPAPLQPHRLQGGSSSAEPWRLLGTFVCSCVEVSGERGLVRCEDSTIGCE